MLSDESGGRSALIILLLLPAPLTAIAIMLGLVLVIADSDAVNLDIGGGDTEVELEPQPTYTISAEIAAISTISAAPARADVAAAPADPVALGYDETVVQTGRVNFLGNCAGCHGVDARGVPGLGKTLIESEFVRARNDQELLEFVVAGRQPFDPESTTMILMPPRGGNPGLTDDDLLTIIAYIRTVDGVAPAGGGEAVAAAEPAEAQDEPADDTPSEPVEFEPIDVGSLLGSDDSEPETSEPESDSDADRDGEAVFDAMCGTTLTDELTPLCDAVVTLAAEMDAESLVTLLQEGSPIWDENNTTGVHIPERGGVFPPLNDAEIMNLVNFLQGSEASDEPASDSDADSEAEGSTDRDGEAVFDAMCGTTLTDELTPLCGALVDLAAEMDAESLVTLLQEGSPVWDENNTTGVHIPERGGVFPPLNDVELANFVEYLKGLE